MSGLTKANELSERLFGVRLGALGWMLAYVLIATFAYGLLGAGIAIATVLGAFLFTAALLRGNYVSAFVLGILSVIILYLLGAVEAVLLYVPIILFLYLVRSLQRRSTKMR
ncbi:MAG: hypothetical protein JJ884_12675 [Maricaulis sp.]|uniref:hypothetical protein n=1 Tax=Maricaulis sp. TaxID=1486257 RepID=UPI001B1A67AA|nr:hypothetical protein [Maricaulis sp.]MBO6729101.1 hypothetical protein [Maricaulis sp.]MBO6848364.1 hypothetical protein [Maricaulis sp.]MBO6878610.1 hypothetical protein [Maricaulis sp.]